jgi:hypothetical protein
MIDHTGIGVADVRRRLPGFLDRPLSSARSEATHGLRGKESRRGRRVLCLRHEGRRNRQRTTRASGYLAWLPGRLLCRVRVRSGWHQRGSGVPRAIDQCG